MKKTLKITLACGLILAMSACSSSKPSDGDATADGTPAATADAGTDAVPAASADTPPPPADGTAAATPPAGDPAAPPPADGMAAATPPAADGTTPPAVAQADTTTPPSPAGSGSFDDYKVQVGDTLMKIAFETYGDLYRWKGILEANKDKVKDPNHIPAGTTLKVEKPATAVAVEKNGQQYLIKTGDTLGTISKDVYGTQKKWKTLWENNKQMIHDPNKIFAGFFLYYQPDANSPKPGDAPTTSPAPLANTNPPPANTATTTGDPMRAPASNDMPPPAAGGTATQ